LSDLVASHSDAFGKKLGMNPRADVNPFARRGCVRGRGFEAFGAGVPMLDEILSPYLAGNSLRAI
jgi:hypothetical protein